MQICWQESPDDRPTFTEICEQLVVLLTDANQQYNYVDAVQTFDIQIDLADSDGEVNV